jgi:hypothetical protein
VFVLAKHTGWTMEHILWEVPLAAVNQADHVFMFIDGVKLRRAAHIEGKEIRDMESLLGL